MNLEVTFWDVGQGDCSVIKLPNGKIIIIDTGPTESPLVAWLSQSSLDIYAIVITHNHEDHIGALIPIIHQCGKRIENVFLAPSHEGKSLYENKIIKSLLSAAKKFSFSLRRLEPCDNGVYKIFSCRSTDDLLIYCCYPGYTAHLENQIKKSPSPNKVSAIIRLDINGLSQIIWPGDVPMQVLSKVCKNEDPFLIVGPHHGGPETRKQQSYLPAFETPCPKNVFVSVGSDNSYNHPLKSDFIELHVAKERVVCCSQLKHCDRRRLTEKRHVLNHHLALGVLPPYSENAVTCRGPMKLTWRSEVHEWEWDQWHQQHQTLLNDVHSPYCRI